MAESEREREVVVEGEEGRKHQGNLECFACWESVLGGADKLFHCPTCTAVRFVHARCSAGKGCAQVHRHVYRQFACIQMFSNKDCFWKRVSNMCSDLYEDVVYMDIDRCTWVDGAIRTHAHLDVYYTYVV